MNGVRDTPSGSTENEQSFHIRGRGVRGFRRHGDSDIHKLRSQGRCEESERQGIMIINFTKPYHPSEEAALHELELAEDMCQAIRDMPVDESWDCMPVERMEKYQAAVKRHEVASRIYRWTRNMHQLGRKVGAVWE